jgi:hypothetical protein
MRLSLFAFLVANFALCACSGGGSGASGVPRATATPMAMVLSATPARIQLADSAQVLITGAAGSISAAVTDPTIVSIGSLLAGGSSATFLVSAIAGGSTTIVVSDTTGATVTIPVSVFICVPPSPDVSLFAEHLTTPAPAASEPPGVETPEPDPYTVLFVTIPSASEFATSVPNYSVQILGPNNAVVPGSNFDPASLSSEYTGFSAPPAPMGDLEFFSTAGALASHGTYRVQLVGQRCVPPQFIGTFSN